MFRAVIDKVIVIDIVIDIVIVYIAIGVQIQLIVASVSRSGVEATARHL